MEDEYGVESMESMGIDEEVEEESEIDVLEFSLDRDGIDELIASLHDLKEHKQHISFPIDDENELNIHYDAEEYDSSVPTTSNSQEVEGDDTGELSGNDGGDLGEFKPDLSIAGEPESLKGDKGDELRRGGHV